jgi:hypothetical protein
MIDRNHHLNKTQSKYAVAASTPVRPELQTEPHPRHDDRPAAEEDDDQRGQVQVTRMVLRRDVWSTEPVR